MPIVMPNDMAHFHLVCHAGRRRRRPCHPSAAHFSMAMTYQLQIEQSTSS
jgi:hypothetical protein